MTSRDSHRHINALAVSAAVLFAIGLTTVLVLARIGVPGRIVGAVGPLLTILGFGLFGSAARNADLASFLAAGRNAPPFYGGLGLTAIIAGMAFCLYPGLASTSDPPPLGLASGVALAAIGIAPLLRRFGATSPNDVVATRFSGSPAAFVSGVAAWATAALTALAGFEVAVTATQALAAPNRLWAEIIVSAVVVLGVAPGGLAGVIWCAAASGGALILIAALGSASAWTQHVASSGSLEVVAAPFDLGDPTSLASLVASALAAAGFFALQPPALASRDAGAAARAGLAGSALCLVLAAMAIFALAVYPVGAGPLGTDPVAYSLIVAATLASVLALAGAAAHASARAFGVALADAPRPFPTPGSVRLARMRLSQISLVVGCAICDSRGVIGSRSALILAMALSLAVTTPLIALAAIGRVGPRSATIATLAALGVGAARVVAMGSHTGAAEAFENALAAAAAAFVAGVLASLVAPRRGPPATPGVFDRFADGSGQAQQQTARILIRAPVARGQNPSPLGRFVAVPGRDDAARSLDDRRERDDVVRL